MPPPFVHPAKPLTAKDAARFLNRATFGATDADIADLMKQGYSAWLAAQSTTQTLSHVKFYMDRRAAAGGDPPSEAEYRQTRAFWKGALIGEAALRERVAFALSQIMVVSTLDDDVTPLRAAGYYDILLKHSLGNFRDLIEDVALSPAMGMYLSHLGNRKTDLATGNTPDQNFARELMQLFTIGRHKLGIDGTVVNDKDGKPAESYTQADVEGLSKIFTGLWVNSPTPPFGTATSDWWKYPKHKETADYTPMVANDTEHETGAKLVLGKTINAGTTMGDIKRGLDVLFEHENVGPFIGRQLIQRLVTSNPSPAYVKRVATVFNNNGNGVRGDLRAVVSAILLDREAFEALPERKAFDGRVVEPLLRFASILRALKAQGVLDPRTGKRDDSFMFARTDDTTYSVAVVFERSLGMTALRAPSVFNFYRPDHFVEGVQGLSTKIVSPEMQISDEELVLSWLEPVSDVLNQEGIWWAGTKSVALDLAGLVMKAEKPADLLDAVLTLLAPHATLSTAKRAKIIATITSESDKRVRVKLAILLLAATPDFIVQR